MPTKGGRREREKRLRYQIKTALDSNHDPFPYFQKLAQLLDQKEPVISSNKTGYSLQPLEITPRFPDYRNIRKGDPRKLAYKLRELFGTDFTDTLPSNHPILPTEQS